MDALSDINTRTTSQAQQADPRQVLNNARGYTFAISPVDRLRRFLILGVEGGTYYTSAPALAQDNAAVVLDFARHRGCELVDEIVSVSVAGRAPTPNPALFALAAAASLADDQGRRYALEALDRVARTGTHLFTFAGYAEQFRGWGSGLRRAVGHWYDSKPVDQLAYQLVKYRHRNGFTHRDLLRLAHPQTTDPARRIAYNWAAGRGLNDAPRVVREWHPGMHLAPLPILDRLERVPDQLAIIADYEDARAATTSRQWTDIIARGHGLPWEALPDPALNTPAVWEALLERGMPQTALMRQLPRLTRLGLLSPMNERTRAVAEQLADPHRLTKARVHPIHALIAQRTYASGQSLRGESTWSPSAPIVDALDAAFYGAFGSIEPTNQRWLLALDVSDSMRAQISGMPLSAREASAAMALVTAKTEPRHEIIGFTDGRGSRWSGAQATVTRLPISPRQRLDDVVRTVARLPFGGTDCALPMLYALNNNIEVDTFVIYTDNETWCGSIHPHQALRRYRERVNPAAKLIVCAMTATKFSIADPDDAGMLDIAGLDAAVPNLITDFARGL